MTTPGIDELINWADRMADGGRDQEFFAMTRDCLKRVKGIEEAPMPHHKAIMEAVNQQAEDEGLWFRAETIAEDYLQRALRKLHAVIEGKEIMTEAPMPEPVAWMWFEGMNMTLGLSTEKPRQAVQKLTPLYGPDLLAYAQRMKEDLAQCRHNASVTMDELGEMREERDELAQEKRDLKAAVGGGILVAKTLANRAEIAESQRDALVRLMREPTNETLGKMMNAWNNSFGSPYTRYAIMLNVAVDDAMSAVAVRKVGAK